MWEILHENWFPGVFLLLNFNMLENVEVKQEKNIVLASLAQSVVPVWELKYRTWLDSLLMSFRKQGLHLHNRWAHLLIDEAWQGCWRWRR